MKDKRMHSTGLKMVMEAQGRKKRWLANAAGLSESYLGRVINRERTISQQNAQRVADTLGTPLFLLFEFTDVSETDTQRAESAA